MKEFVKKLTKKDDIIIFFVIFCISIGIALNLSIVAMDETWNFQSTYKMYNGYEIYKDFNVIITPLFFWCAEFLFHVFGANLAVFRISHCILMSIYYLVLYKLLKKLDIPKPISLLVILGFITIGFSEVISFPLIRTGFNYNQMAMLFVILGIYLLTSKRFHKNYILQAMFTVLAFWTKQTIGIYFGIANIIYLIISDNTKEEIIKKGIQYISLTVIGMLIFLLILYSNNSLYDFFNYTFGSIVEFADKNIAFEVNSLAFLLGITLLNIITSILVIKKKCFSREQEENIKRLLIFSIIFTLVAYPIFNQFHVILVISLSVINLVYVIYNLFKDFKESICEIVKVINWGCVIGLIIFSGYHLLQWQKSINSADYPYSWEEPFFGGIITQEEYQKNEMVIQYIQNNEKNVIVLSDKAVLYMVPLKRNNGDFDLPLRGNFGSQGEEGLIEKIKHIENTQFLIYNGEEKVVYQEVEKTKEYIKNTMEYVGKIDDFDIYE